jgi:hypothetical protein
MILSSQRSTNCREIRTRDLGYDSLRTGTTGEHFRARARIHDELQIKTDSLTCYRFTSAVVTLRLKNPLHSFPPQTALLKTPNNYTHFRKETAGFRKHALHSTVGTTVGKHRYPKSSNCYVFNCSQIVSFPGPLPSWSHCLVGNRDYCQAVLLCSTGSRRGRGEGREHCAKNITAKCQPALVPHSSTRSATGQRERTVSTTWRSTRMSRYWHPKHEVCQNVNSLWRFVFWLV